MSRNALNLNLLNYNMKILQVAFLLLFNYLDSLPKLYYILYLLVSSAVHARSLHPPTKLNVIFCSQCACLSVIDNL